MRKVVTGVLAILIAGTGGYFGARGWAQQRVEQEVETSLAAMRAPGGNVTHGPVEFASAHLNSRKMMPPSRRRAPKTARRAASHHRSDFGWGN